MLTCHSKKSTDLKNKKCMTWRQDPSLVHAASPLNSMTSWGIGLDQSHLYIYTFATLTLFKVIC